MAKQSFVASVDSWVSDTKERLVAVQQKAVELLINEMDTPKAKGGFLPVVDGFLRNSLIVTIGSPATSITFKEGNSAGSPSNWEMIVKGFEAGETLYAVYTAAYANRVHYGFTGTDSLGRNYNQSAQPWVDLAAQNWQTHVDKAVALLKTEVNISQ